MMAAVPGYGSSASKVGHSGRARVWWRELRKKSLRPLLRDTCQGVRSSDAASVGFRYVFRSEEG